MQDEDEELALKDNFPKWKETDQTRREMSLEVELILHKERDAGLYQVVTKQLSIEPPSETLQLTLGATVSSDRKDPTVVIRTGGQEYTGINAEEVLKKLQSSRAILFHNSTKPSQRYMPGASIAGYIREISGQHAELVTGMKKTVTRGMGKISKTQQQEFENLLGRLQTKYKVGLSIPAFDFGYFPFSITLGDSKYEVPLDDWGSGTRNRTLILLALFRAKQVGESEASASKITPVIIVEEPESFLHPSAQAEFGRVLHDLAEEFQVQVIVTTHSPYLLSLRDPASNILLRRRSKHRHLRDTERVETSGDNWMAPFGQALGLEAEEFKPWKELMLTGSDSILLVEGDTDKEYFEILRRPEHGANGLSFAGDIVPYDGTGSLANTILLRFIKNRFRNLFVTFDLEAASKVLKTLECLQLERGQHYLPIGLNTPGKRSIEGLLPERVITAVYAAHSNLVQTATSGTKEEQESAKNRLKRLLLEEFKRVARPGQEDFGHFYTFTRVINRAVA